MFLEIALASSLSITPLPPRDRWFGEDKLRHFFVSAVVTSLSASGARAAGLRHEESLAVGIGAGAAAGIWKEIRDHGRPGETASFRDLVWDFAGVAAAAAVVHQGRRSGAEPEEQPQPNRWNAESSAISPAFLRQPRELILFAFP